MKKLVSKYSVKSWNTDDASKISYWVLIIASLVLYANSIASLVV